ncbi:hypothetical protein D6829_01725, partial [Candidatus Pacearchaeota archaeon]
SCRRGEFKTYNLKEVAGTNSYFADGFLVHNKGGGTGGGGDEEIHLNLDDFLKKSAKLSYGKKIYLKVKGKEYLLVVRKVSGDKVVFLFGSVLFEVRNGTSAYLDVDGDGIREVRVLLDFKRGQAFFSRLKGKRLVENVGNKTNGQNKSNFPVESPRRFSAPPAGFWIVFVGTFLIILGYFLLERFLRKSRKRKRI